MRTKVIDCHAGPTLDAAVAEARGWKWIAYSRSFGDCVVMRWLVPPEEFKPKLAAKGDEPVGYSNLPKCSSDNAEAWELGNGLPANLREKYVESLLMVCGFEVQLFDSALERDRPDVSIPEALCALVFATPLQRSKAFLLASGIEYIET